MISHHQMIFGYDLRREGIFWQNYLIKKTTLFLTMS